MENKNLVHIRYKHARCNICDSNDFTQFWKYTRIARTKSRHWLFKVSNVVCDNCGFSFVSPEPLQEDLDLYYTDSFPKLDNQPTFYNENLRLDLLRKYCSGTGAYLELGANTRSNFHKQLFSFFTSVATLEKNAECDSDFTSFDQVPDQSIDVFAHYGVLEHITNPKSVLTNGYRILKDGGLMVCEVPDIRLYPRMMTNYIFWEHVSHFSPHTLSRLAQSCGFDLIELGHSVASSSQLFLAVFKKNRAPVAPEMVFKDPIEVAENQACLKEGKRFVDEFYQIIYELRKKMRSIEAAGERVTVYGANDVTRYLFEDNVKQSNFIRVIDDDPRKENFLDQDRVYSPEEIVDHIKTSSLLVVCSERLKDRMVKRAENVSDRRFSQSDIFVLDYKEMLSFRMQT